MKQKMHYFLMVSCPSDVIKEREILQESIDIINRERTDDVWIELKYWLTDTYSDAGVPAQESINSQIVNESDALIAIFNSRLGTPVHDFCCGTEEEIQLMLNAHKHVFILFNTNPKIDLTKDDAIMQITQLQNYKTKQAQKAYYREFNSNESFKTTILQEIRLWLRELTSSESPKNHIITETNNGSVNFKDNLYEFNVDPSSKSEIEDGAVDCVIFLINITKELNSLLFEFSSDTKEYTSTTTQFAEELSMLNKQKNPQLILRLCKNYALSTDIFAEKINTFSSNFIEKWNSFYSYLLKISKNHLSNEDKIITRNAVANLKIQYEKAKNSIVTLVKILENIPNMQKDISVSAKKLKNNFSSLISKFNLAIENCYQIEAVLS